MYGCADRVGADINTSPVSETTHRTAPILSLVEYSICGAEFQCFVEFPLVAAGDDGAATEVVGDIQGRERYPAANSGDEYRLTSAEPGLGSKHPPGRQVGQSVGCGLNGIFRFADHNGIARRSRESLRVCARRMLADHVDFTPRWRCVRAGLVGDLHREVEYHPLVHPRFIDARADADNSPASI